MSTLTNLFTDIADAIRSKKGTTDLINATDFATEILNLSSNPEAFFDSITPTTWSSLSDTEYSATNDYGEWKISTSSHRGSQYVLTYGFDGDDTTCYSSAALEDGEKVDVTIECPTNLLIKPCIIKLKYKMVGSGSVIQGYNPDTEEWENLGTLTVTQNETSLQFDISSGKNYYSKFRVYATRSGALSSRLYVYIYEFQITGGYIK